MPCAVDRAPGCARAHSRPRLACGEVSACPRACVVVRPAARAGACVRTRVCVRSNAPFVRPPVPSGPLSRRLKNGSRLRALFSTVGCVCESHVLMRFGDQLDQNVRRIEFSTIAADAGWPFFGAFPRQAQGCFVPKGVLYGHPSVQIITRYLCLSLASIFLKAAPLSSIGQSAPFSYFLEAAPSLQSGKAPPFYIFKRFPMFLMGDSGHLCFYF